ncbi:MAG: alkaline phosphatase D family protein [Planctomycetota bacterium]|jgi:alkaline phosphatase D|nr:alkaline phosphatase D family protein [Planctomycetota bacterium]MDA1026367.1 alkaline phosphatase D family protein [Planctomycetota bacterium]
MNFISVLVLVCSTPLLLSTAEQVDSADTAESVELAGPMLGDLTADSVRIWLRTAAPRSSVVEIKDADGEVVRRCPLQTTAESDHTGILEVLDLAPAARFTFSIDGKTDPDWWFRTRPASDVACRIAFGSCADEGDGSASVWRRMEGDEVTALVLLGDTPYIDTTDLARQRSRYRAFAQPADFARLVSHVPVYSTWDDHDFGRNDTDGNLPGKENSRQAVTEYRPNPSFGENGEGIYTNFRQGPVEVFLLDARWFARTEGDLSAPTLLGARQWAWLERSLAASTAPFKVLACGMVFNGSVRPFKTDCWGVYPAEYDRLIDLIARVKSQGVVLVSGDVHWSRVIRHDTKDRLGYDLMEFVTSPIHEKLIPAANPPHPGLVFSVGEINSFLLVDAVTADDASTLVARIRNAAGQDLHVEEIAARSGDAVPTP